MADEFGYEHREQVIWSLELFASREKQLEYKRTVPIADVLGEMFCFWHDAFTNQRDLSRHFTSEEWEALVVFDEVQEKVCRSLTPSILGIPIFPQPSLSRFQESPLSTQLAEAAAKALQAIYRENSHPPFP